MEVVPGRSSILSTGQKQLRVGRACSNGLGYIGSGVGRKAGCVWIVHRAGRVTEGFCTGADAMRRWGQRTSHRRPALLGTYLRMVCVFVWHMGANTCGKVQNGNVWDGIVSFVTGYVSLKILV